MQRTRLKTSTGCSWSSGLRWHCTENRKDSMGDVTAWAQEHFQSRRLSSSVLQPQMKNKNQIQTLLWSWAQRTWTETKLKTVLWSDQCVLQAEEERDQHTVVHKKHKHTLKQRETGGAPSCHLGFEIWFINTCSDESVHLKAAGVQTETQKCLTSQIPVSVKRNCLSENMKSNKTSSHVFSIWASINSALPCPFNSNESNESNETNDCHTHERRHPAGDQPEPNWLKTKEPGNKESIYFENPTKQKQSTETGEFAAQLKLQRQTA